MIFFRLQVEKYPSQHYKYIVNLLCNLAIYKAQYNHETT